MLESKWFKSILYIVYTLGCAFSGYVIYYTAQDGMLYTPVFEHLIAKLIIIGVPIVLCIILDMMYYPFEMLDAFLWKASVGIPFVCLLIGYIVVNDKQEINLFGWTIPCTLIYILMYALSVGITYLAGLLGIWVAADDTPRPPRPSEAVISDEEHRKMLQEKYEMFVEKPVAPEPETDAYGRPF